MADDYRFDLHTPHPNVDIDTMRQAVVQALDDIEAAAAGVDDTYWLSDLLFSLLDSALAAVTAADTERQQLRDDLAALTERVAALELPLP